jgi:hypothetical protein
MGKWDIFPARLTQGMSDLPIPNDTTRRHQIKTEMQIEELTKKIDALTQWNPLPVAEIVPTPQTSTGSAKKLDIIPASGKLLAKLMPTYEFTLTENKGIYDLYIFDKSAKYSTYTDTKKQVTLIATNITYDALLKNFRALSKDVYSINENKTFPFRSFYINPPKSDATVRIAVEIESQSLLLQLPKTRFVELKALLLKK